MKYKRNILVFTYWSIDNALIHTYTLPYLRQILACHSSGSKIYLLTLSPPGVKNSETIQMLIRSLKDENILVLNFTYHPFGLKMVLNFLLLYPYLLILTMFKGIGVLHAWCTPGAAFAWPISIITRKPLVIDSFEPHAESMLEAGVWKKESWSYKILFWLEKRQLIRACRIICAAPGMMRHAQNIYGIKKEERFVKPACVNLELFNPDRFSKSPRLKGLKGKVCIYAGKFGDIYLKKEAFEFFKAAFDHWQGEFTVLLLSNQSENEVKSFCMESGFPFSQLVQRFVPHEEVASYLAMADFAFAAIKPLPSKKYCSPIKTGEYWAMGLPVVIPDHISVDSKIIEEQNAGIVLHAFTASEYKQTLIKLEGLLAQKGLKDRIREIAVKTRSFDISASIYQTIYAKAEVCSDAKE